MRNMRVTYSAMATDWAALEVEFINGSMTYKELGDKYGLKEGTVRQRANRNAWYKKRNELSQSVTEAAQEALTEQRVDALAELNRQDLELAARIRQKADELLMATTSASELRAIAGAHEVAQKVSRLAMGATTENTGVSAPNGGPVQTANLSSSEFEEIAKRVASEI